MADVAREDLAMTVIALAEITLADLAMADLAMVILAMADLAMARGLEDLLNDRRGCTRGPEVHQLVSNWSVRGRPGLAGLFFVKFG